MEKIEDRLKILVVLYKKRIYESETIISILECKHELRSIDSLIIWNNSPFPLSTEEKCKLKEEINPVNLYFEGGDGTNHTLPSIYTKVYKNTNCSDILIVFDHDSIIPLKYFTELLVAVERYRNINLFLPIVYSGKYIVSPSYMFVVKGIYWRNKHFGQLNTKNITAINSGMAIRCSYLLKDFEGYNMQLQFYETDNDFMYKYNKSNTSLYVLKSCINHSLDFYEGKNVENKLERFIAMRQGRLLRTKSLGYWLYCFAYIQYLYFGIKCALKYRERRFVFFATGCKCLKIMSQFV